MTKLYYTSTSCGASNFIAAFVGGLSIDCEEVSLQDHKTASGVDFYTINPKGNVPCLVLDDGTILNENAATLQYIADKATTTKVIPAAGTVERYAVIGALSYISSEVHGNFAHLFNPSLDPIVQTYARGNLDRKLKYVNDVLVGEKTFVVGDSFTVADSYLYIALSWAGYVNVDLSPFPNVVRYYDGIKAMESVQAAHERMATSPSTTL